MSAMSAPWTPAMEAELRYLVRREYQHQQRVDAACRGKPAFTSSKAAHDSLPRRTVHGRVTVYRCDVCNKWHVGSHLSKATRDKRPMRLIGGDDEGLRL